MKSAVLAFLIFTSAFTFATENDFRSKVPANENTCATLLLTETSTLENAGQPTLLEGATSEDVFDFHAAEMQRQSDLIRNKTNWLALNNRRFGLKDQQMMGLVTCADSERRPSGKLETRYANRGFFKNETYVVDSANILFKNIFSRVDIATIANAINDLDVAPATLTSAEAAFMGVRYFPYFDLKWAIVQIQKHEYIYIGCTKQDGILSVVDAARLTYLDYAYFQRLF